MSTKTITITEEAYNTLKGLKEENESFTDAILKFARKDPLSQLVGVLSKKDASEMRKRIAESRKRSRDRLDRIVKRFK